MAASVQCCLAIPSKLRALSINSSSSSTRLSSLSFSANLSHSFFSKGSLSKTAVLRPKRQSLAVVCEAAPTRRVNPAAKRTRQAEQRSVFNKARKSQVKTTMKKGRGGVSLGSHRRIIQRKFLELTTSEVLSKADFKNTRFLVKFITERGKIIRRSQTGISIKAQRKIVREIKVARCFGLLPFTTQETKTKSFAI